MHRPIGDGGNNEFRHLIWDIEIKEQEWVDAHFGEPYRLGEDDELDLLHERRISFFVEANSSAWSDYEWRAWDEFYEEQRDIVRSPKVKHRLTTRERVRRGLLGNRPAI